LLRGILERQGAAWKKNESVAREYVAIRLLGSYLDRMWNEAKDQQQKREKREEQAFGIKRSGIANRGSRKETKAKQYCRPDIPTWGMAEKSKKNKTRRQG